MSIRNERKTKNCKTHMHSKTIENRKKNGAELVSEIQANVLLHYMWYYYRFLFCYLLFSLTQLNYKKKNFKHSRLSLLLSI